MTTAETLVRPTSDCRRDRRPPNLCFAAVWRQEEEEAIMHKVSRLAVLGALGLALAGATPVALASGGGANSGGVNSGGGGGTGGGGGGGNRGGVSDAPT